MLYFVPNRVAEEYRQFVDKPHKHNMPVIKRKLSAMVYATKWRRELIDEEKQIYRHNFNGIILIVEDKNHCISSVSKKFELTSDIKSTCFYKQNCRNMGLNSNRDDFSPEYKKQIEQYKSL